MQHPSSNYTPSWQLNHVPSPLATGRSGSPPAHHYLNHYDSPRAAKRSRSKSSSREADMDIDARRLRPVLPHLRTSVCIENLPTPPLSSSSSVSSGGSIGSTSSGSISSFPRSFSMHNWQPSSAGFAYASPPEAKLARSGRGYQSLGPEELQGYANNGFATPALRSDEVYDYCPDYQKTQHENQIAASHPQLSSSAQPTPPPAPALDAQQLQLDASLEPAPDAKFVEGLVGTSMLAIESIWSTSQTTYEKPSSDKVLPLKYFIKETLRRSRSSITTLQVALYYLHRARVPIRERVVFADKAKERFSLLSTARKLEQERILVETGYATPPGSPSEEFTRAASEVLATSRDPVVCGRRMFLASLICASKFLQDRNYSNRAWSRLSGLPVQEINANERAFLDVLGYELFIKPETFTSWCARLHKLAVENEVRIMRLTMSPTRGAFKRSSTDYNPAPMLGDGPSFNGVPTHTRLATSQRSSLSRSTNELDSLRRRSIANTNSNGSVSLQSTPMVRRSSDAIPYAALARISSSERKQSTAFGPASVNVPNGIANIRPQLTASLSSRSIDFRRQSTSHPSWLAAIDVC